MNRRIADSSPPRRRPPLMTLGPAHFVLLGAGLLLVLLMIWFTSFRMYD